MSTAFSRPAGAAFMPRRFLAVLLLACAALLGACSDDGDDDGTGPTGVNGMWETPGLYMHVSSDEITFYIDLDGCYGALTYDVVDIDGDTYEVEFEGDPAGEIVLDRNGSTMDVDVEGESLTMEQSDVDESDLEICADTDPSDVFDPTLSTCSSYNELTLGVPQNGSLTGGDATDPNGFLYDVHRVQISGTPTVEIAQRSDQIDSYLYLYNSTGTLIAFDDDGGDNFNSIVTEPLTAGCYIVVVSSYSPGETGDYEIEANAF
jgi:hypothetical protein